MINLDTITVEELEKMLYDLAHKAYDADKAYVKADEEFQMLDDAKKPYLAVLMDGFDVKTQAEKERLAYASLDFSQWQLGYQQARKKARQARVERDNLQRLWESCRSIMSSRNVQRRTGI